MLCNVFRERIHSEITAYESYRAGETDRERTEIASGGVARLYAPLRFDDEECPQIAGQETDAHLWVGALRVLYRPQDAAGFRIPYIHFPLV